jgi:adenylosuccinate synthase
VSFAGRHPVVVDLGYGDAGKGTVVDRICTDGPVSAVIRFNGGAQAAHNVMTADGRHHTFAQFGSGTLHGVPTHLSRFTSVDPLALAAEADHLATLGVPDPFGLLTVDAEALLTTPWHRAANRVRERRRGSGRHGSCGLGVGETTSYAQRHADPPRAGDACDPVRLRQRLAAVRDRLTDELGELDAPALDQVVPVFRAFGAVVSIVDGESTLRRLLDAGRCVFEGAQGVLLDEWFGWHPYTTWSTTTFANAETLLAEAGYQALRLGVVRTYTTRHGAGPLVTEDPALTAALPDRHNGTGRWQGAFRVGHFDAVAHRYAVEVAGGVDALAVTHLDVAERQPELAICPEYVVSPPPVDATSPVGQTLPGGGRAVIRLAPGERGDLAYQERLTALLGRARPAQLDRPAHWPSAIGTLLGAPVLIESYGPSTADKRTSGEFSRQPRRTLAPADRLAG